MLAKSSAVVSVYKGNGNVPIASLTVDGESEGVYWDAFEIKIESSSVIEVNPINKYGYRTTCE